MQHTDDTATLEHGDKIEPIEAGEDFALDFYFVEAAPGDLTVADDDDAPAEPAEPVVAPALETPPPDVHFAVKRGISALVSDDPDFARRVAPGLTFDDSNPGAFTIMWAAGDERLADFVHVTSCPEGYEVTYCTSPNFNKEGVTADFDATGETGAVRQALGTLRVANQNVASSLLGRVIRHVQAKQEVEALLATGVVKEICTNIRKLLKDVPGIPLMAPTRLDDPTDFVAHFALASPRSMGTHMGIVVAKTGDAVVLNTVVRATYLVHRVGKQHAATLQIGDPASITYSMDTRLSGAVKVGRPSLAAVEEKHLAVQQLKKGKALNERRGVVLQAAADAQMPDPAEVPVPSRPVTVAEAVQLRKTGRSNEGR
ncbi:hypothetical protein [Ramlibacter alkalitolerans]|uniref:Uncharacterized protein n=1 Tax=Ramlibacter alkalitolerans TaxID=2039631 RepID=A0ABS1JTZ4_9BURK|nr:hypothetical protein [Ramlibacter alkalitolerans]MBL0427774.1 hypothetical protein [Ramlibacter alkalitolerans]